MLERIYFSIWGLYILTAAIFYLSGSFTSFTAVVFGFVFFGLTFMGMIGVLPFYVTHHTHHPKH